MYTSVEVFGMGCKR